MYVELESIKNLAEASFFVYRTEYKKNPSKTSRRTLDNIAKTVIFTQKSIADIDKYYSILENNNSIDIFEHELNSLREVLFLATENHKTDFK